MHKSFPLMILVSFVLIFTFVSLPIDKGSAEIADGTHSINYEVKEAGSNSTSIADGYFSKPATLIVKNGVKHIQLTVTSATMIKSLSTSAGAVQVVSDSGDTRVVKFRVDGDLSQPVNINMHIDVPDMPEMPGGYSMDHTARAVFNVSGLATAGAAPSKDAQANDAAAATTSEANPPTGDNSSVALYMMLLLGSSVVAITIWRKSRVTQN